MRENNKKKEKIFEKRGFFVTIIVAMSIIVIAVVMNMIVPNDVKKESFDQETWNQAVKESAKVNDFYSANSETKKMSPVEQENEDVKSKKADESVLTANETDVDDVNTKEAKTVLFEKPISGEIIKDYSVDELLYSDTMQDWRVHEGLDFSAEEGADVRAVADGVIEAVMEDGMLGTCVIISHNDGLKSLYGNLQEGSPSLVGTQVKTGDVIAKAGNTAVLEISDRPHIHFEVLKGDERLNPHDFISDTVEDDE